VPGAWAPKWKRSLAGAVSSEAQAYGFAITTWCSGAFLLYEHGKPAPPGIFAFAGGALAAMMLAILLGIGGPRGRLQPPPPPRAYGAMHPFSVFGAVLSEWPIAAAVPGVYAFFVGPFAAVLVYQLLVSVELALATDE
jgi:hypothetical protein